MVRCLEAGTSYLSSGNLASKLEPLAATAESVCSVGSTGLVEVAD